MASSSGTGELPPDVNLGPAMLKAIWIEAGLAIIAIAARLYGRLKVMRKIQIDDYLMVLALALALASGSLATVSVEWGFGRHIFHLTPIQQVNAVKYQSLAQPLLNMSMASGRISFAVTLIMLMGKSTSQLGRGLLYSLIVGQLVFNIAFTIVELAMCRPMAKFWNPTGPGECWDPKVLVYAGYISQSFNVFTDFALAVFPATQIVTLSIRFALKVGLVFLMGLGVFNMAAAIVTTVMAELVNSRGDITYDYVVMDIWGAVQAYLVIIAASVPAIRPLFRGLRINGLSKLIPYRYRSKDSAGLNDREHELDVDDSNKSGPAPHITLKSHGAFVTKTFQDKMYGRTVNNTSTTNTMTGTTLRSDSQEKMITNDEYIARTV